MMFSVVNSGREFRPDYSTEIRRRGEWEGLRLASRAQVRPGTNSGVQVIPRTKGSRPAVQGCRRICDVK